MSDITKINFSKDIFQRPDTSAVLNGSVYIDQNLYVKNIELDTSGATTNSILIYDGQKFKPQLFTSGNTYTSGNGITIGTGNTIDLGGQLNSGDTIIKGASGSTSLLFLGGTAQDENLAQLYVNALSILFNVLTSYDGTGKGTFVNIGSGSLFVSNNNSLNNTVSAIYTGDGFSFLNVRDNRKILIIVYNGILNGSGESFTINGVTFTEGTDFIGQNDPILDAATIAGLDYSSVPDFISVNYTIGEDSITFNFSNPAVVSDTFTGAYIMDGIYYTHFIASENGLTIGQGYTQLLISESLGNTFYDNAATPHGIEYDDDYSATYTNRSLVDKEYVDNRSILHATALGTDIYTATVSGITSYNDGDAYLIHFTNGNTTEATLDINGLGAKTLYKNNNGVLIGGDIISEGEMICVYNSSLDAFQVIGTSPNSLIAYVTNADSVTITKGMVVYAFGGQGDRMTVKLASNSGDSTSAQTVGLVLSASIDAGQKGFIMMQGLLDGLSILPTSTFSDGDPIYLGSTAGSITNVKPYAPNHLVYLGVVTTASNGSAGRMYVKVQNGYELDELHNVQAQSPSLKDTLWYDNTVSPAQWKTASIVTILGYTPLEGNAAITGATKTKITYDSKGLVTAGADLEASDLPSGIDASKIADGSVSNTEFQYLGGVTSDIQTQINNINSGISTKKFINNTPTAAHTGTTTNTIVQSVLIPANTYTVGDIIKITMRGNKTTNNAVMTLRYYINTSNSLSGATLLATLTQSGAFAAAIGMSRNLSITSETTTETINPTATTNTQDEGLRDNISLNTNINIDWTSEQYIIFAFQLGNISDSATVNHYIIEKR